MWQPNCVHLAVCPITDIQIASGHQDHHRQIASHFIYLESRAVPPAAVPPWTSFLIAAWINFIGRSHKSSCAFRFAAFFNFSLCSCLSSGGSWLCSNCYHLQRIPQMLGMFSMENTSDEHHHSISCENAFYSRWWSKTSSLVHCTYSGSCWFQNHYTIKILMICHRYSYSRMILQRGLSTM